MFALSIFLSRFAVTFTICSFVGVSCISIVDLVIISSFEDGTIAKFNVTEVTSNEECFISLTINDEKKTSSTKIKFIIKNVLPIDTTAPVITLIGENSIPLYVGDAYNELGATALDNGLNIEVTKTGNVDTSAAGTYTITYTATDGHGNTSTKSRTITVTNRPSSGGGYIFPIVTIPPRITPQVLGEKISDSSLFKYKNSPKIYLLENGLQRWIKDEYTFLNKGYKWSDVKTLDDDTTYPNGDDLVLTPTQNTFKFLKKLQSKSTGKDVAELQTLLKKLGYFTYPSITNYYGNNTVNAVKKFQKANNIAQVGYVGPATLAALNKQVK